MPFPVLFFVNVSVIRRLFSSGPSFDFTSPHQCSDGVIVIDGVRLHVVTSY